MNRKFVKCRFYMIENYTKIQNHLKNLKEFLKNVNKKWDKFKWNIWQKALQWNKNESLTTTEWKIISSNVNRNFVNVNDIFQQTSQYIFSTKKQPQNNSTKRNESFN